MTRKPRTRSESITQAIANARLRGAAVTESEKSNDGDKEVDMVDSVGLESNLNILKEPTHKRKQLPPEIHSGRYDAVPVDEGFEAELDSMFGLLEEGTHENLEKKRRKKDAHPTTKKGKKVDRQQQVFSEIRRDSSTFEPGDSLGVARSHPSSKLDHLATQVAHFHKSFEKNRPIECEVIQKDKTRVPVSYDLVHVWRTVVQQRLFLQKLLHIVMCLPNDDLAQITDRVKERQHQVLELIDTILTRMKPNCIYNEDHNSSATHMEESVAHLCSEISSLYQTQGLTMPVYHEDYWKSRCQKNRSKLLRFGSSELLEYDPDMFNDDDLYTVLALRISQELGPQALLDLPSPAQRAPLSRVQLLNSSPSDTTGPSLKDREHLHTPSLEGKARRNTQKARFFVSSEPIPELVNFKPRNPTIPYASEALIRSLFRD